MEQNLFVGVGFSPSGAAQAQSRGKRVTAAIMISGGENAVCRLGNIADTAIVRVNTSTHSLRRYIEMSGLGNCAVLPITAPVGSRVVISGVLQDTLAIPGAASSLNSPSTQVVESCFNVEAFSLGLAANSQSEFDPQDLTNIINAQGFGFMWYDSDNDLKPGGFGYSIVGCSGRTCPTTVAYFNTDTFSVALPNCAVLTPLS